MKPAEWKYGYQTIKRIPAADEPALFANRDAPRCQKCRSLVTADGFPACGKGHELGTAPVCVGYSDCGKPRDFLPHSYYHIDVRR